MNNSSAPHLQNAADELALARDRLIVGVADAVNSGVDAAREVKAKVGEGVDSMLDQGRGLIDHAADAIRTRPWKAVGVAIASGYVLQRLARRG